jgi:hypothetical protein
MSQLAGVTEKYDKNTVNVKKLTEGLSEFQVQYLIYKGAYSALHNKLYRTQRNEDAKDARKVMEIVRQDPELAERLGLGKRA